MKETIRVGIQDYIDRKKWLEVRKAELETLLQNYAMQNAKLKVGDRVNVHGYDGNVIGQAIIGAILPMVSMSTNSLGVFDTHFDRRVDMVKYELFAITKDGKQSMKHFQASIHCLCDTVREGWEYITPI